jgi:hypothetical protein
MDACMYFSISAGRSLWPADVFPSGHIGWSAKMAAMTVYAFDEARHVLISSWDVGIGCVAGVVAEVPASALAADVLTLASRLTRLSRELWRTYTHPASAADSLEANTEGWRRQGEREAFATVIPAIKNPHLPEAGEIIQSYIRVEEVAHQVGRSLHAIGDAGLTEHVIADMAEELAAVELAEQGDLSGRARQAVVLTRADISPLQIVAADDLLRAHPLGSKRLFEEVDPTAAAVAAAHWLYAAAQVASGVVVEADDIEALPVQTPTLVLQRLSVGATPREVVIELVKGAMAVAEGEVPDPELLIEQVREAQERVGHYTERYGEVPSEVVAELMPRTTPLDPTRPAKDLLEDLLAGIRGCWLLYREYNGYESDGDFALIESEEDFEAEADAITEKVDGEFLEAVRAEAAANRGGLL